MTADLPLSAFVPELRQQLTRGDLLISGGALARPDGGLRGSVAWRGQPVHLTRGETKIVVAMALSSRTLTYREIIETMHRPGWAVSDDSVVARVHVKRIRQKFKAADPKFDRIETHYTVGYSWRG